LLSDDGKGPASDLDRVTRNGGSREPCASIEEGTDMQGEQAEVNGNLNAYLPLGGRVTLALRGGGLWFCWLTNRLSASVGVSYSQEETLFYL
jgi:hypothetical protein